LRIETLNDTATFAYLPSLEPAWGVISLLMGEPSHTLCSELYGSEQISAWKRKYNFLFESYKAIEKFAPANIMDFLLDMPIERISLETYRELLLSMSPAAFLWRIMDMEYCGKASKEVLQKALYDDAALDAAYSWFAEECDSFLAFAASIRQSKRFITEFFALASELDNADLHQALELLDGKVEQMARMAAAGIAEKGALEYSESQMGKTFRNRGPYAEFVFLPSYLLPYKACRYFHVEGERKRQFLFLTLRTSYHTQADTVKALKAISDATRYQILALLAKEGTMKGFEISKALSIATSTVSHHMDQLKESGLITEEPVKNAKYYGLNKQTAKELISEITNDFCIET